MNANDLTCPYCNARTPFSAVLPTGRTTCTRCGESFVAAGSTAIQPSPGITSTPSPVAAPVVRRATTRRNLLTLGIVLAVMCLMASISLTYSLMTQDVRRQHDKELPRRSRRPALPPVVKKEDPEPEPDPIDPVAPKELAALGYLTSDTGLVVGLHVGELLTSPVGKEWREKSIPLLGQNLKLSAVRDLVGISASEIDHIVLGMPVRAGDMPDLTPSVSIIVRTRKPYDRAKLLEKLDAAPPTGKRQVYEVKLRGIAMSLWLADDKTFALGLFSKLEHLPDKPRSGLDHLPKSLAGEIGERFPEGTPLWLAGHAEDWSKTFVPTLFAAMPELPLAEHIKDVKSFAIGIVPGKTTQLNGAFNCRDEATAKKLEAEQLAPRRQKDPQTFTYSRNGELLLVQVKFTGL